MAQYSHLQPDIVRNNQLFFVYTPPMYVIYIMLVHSVYPGKSCSGCPQYYKGGKNTGERETDSHSMSLVCNVIIAGGVQILHKSVM